MTKRLLFDTLEYAKMLEKGGVEHSGVHSVSLAYALNQNLYTKDEINNMFEATMKELREQTQKLHEHISNSEKRTQELTYEIRLDLKEFENRLDMISNRVMYKCVGILGSLIVVIEAINAFFHYFH